MFDVTRKELFSMTTQQLFNLNGELTILKQRVEAELVCRGDF